MNKPNYEIVWKPQAGPQTLLLNCPVPDILFGGARGGGKTDGLMGSWMAHASRHGSHARGILFRRSMSELEEVQNRMMEVFPAIGAVFKVSTKTWTMPGEATLKMRFLDADEDATKYQGHAYTWMGVDEAGNFPSSKPLDMLRACLRSVHGIPCQLTLSANPGGKGHDWIKERYIDPARPLTPFQGPDGTMRVFIPSRLQDNALLTAADPTYIDRLKASGPSWLVRAWLEGDWNARQEGALFKRGWFVPYIELPTFECIIISLDTAFKTGTQNDYSVATVWGVTKTGFYLLDMWRSKVEFFELKAIVNQLAAKWSPSAVLIEDKASGQSLIQELKRDTRLPVVPIKVDTDKISRTYAITPTCEAGRVFLPEHAPWLDDLLDELMMFPSGPHDDQVDSMTQALAYLQCRRGPMVITDELLRVVEEMGCTPLRLLR